MNVLLGSVLLHRCVLCWCIITPCLEARLFLQQCDQQHQGVVRAEVALGSCDQE